MADLGNRGAPWHPNQHQRVGSDMAPGVAGVGAGAGAVAGYEDTGPDTHEGVGLRYRRTQSAGHGQDEGEGYYDAAATGGYFGGPSRAPDGGYGAARFVTQPSYDPSQGHGAYADPPDRNVFADTQGGPSKQYLPTAAGSTTQLPNPHPPSPPREERMSAAYGGYDDGDPFAARSQLSHSAGHHSPQPLLSSGESPLPRRSDEVGDAASDAGSLGDEEDYAGGRRVLKVCDVIWFSPLVFTEYL